MKARLAAGETLVGAFLALGSPAAAEALALAGFDWLLVDLEHGAGDESQLLGQLLAATAAGVPALVRVESAAPARAARALDLGAAGVTCPHVDSASEAAAWAEAIRSRGIATTHRAARYGLAAPADPLVVAMIESPAAVADAAAIAAVPGIDALFAGPTDLAHALGRPRDLADPALRAAIEQVAAAGKPAGLFARDPAEVALARALGLRLIAAGSDVGFLLRGAALSRG